MLRSPNLDARVASARATHALASRSGDVLRQRVGTPAFMDALWALLLPRACSGSFDMGEHRNNQGAATHTATAHHHLARVPVAPLDSLLLPPSLPAQTLPPHASPQPLLPPPAPPPRPLFVKMDIEGGECRALRGMRRLLESSRIIGTNQRSSSAPPHRPPPLLACRALGTSASAAACADGPSSRHLRIGRLLC